VNVVDSFCLFGFVIASNTVPDHVAVDASQSAGVVTGLAALVLTSVDCVLAADPKYSTSIQISSSCKLAALSRIK
jgi:hypothetical protein